MDGGLVTGERDAYERQYMDPGERLLFREKVVSRTAFLLSLVFGIVFGGVGLFVTLAAILGPAPLQALVLGLPSLAFGVMMAVLGAAFSVFRAMVTSSHVLVHFGWAKRKIPMDAIDDVAVVTLTGFRQGKVSIGLDGVVRTWVGHAASGRGVAITYRDGARKHVITLGSDQPERFVETIGAARAAARAGEPAQARIADGEGLEVAADEADEAREAAAEPSSPHTR